MNIFIIRIAAIIMVFLLTGLFWQLQSSSKFSSKDKTRAVIGNDETFLVAYERWKVIAKQNGADRSLVLPLTYSKALSNEFTSARGTATVDLINGSISVEVSGLSDEEIFDVWLIDNRPAPDHSVKPEPWDKLARVGSLKHEGATSRLEARLDREALKDFKIDLVAIAQDNKDPGEAGLLFGSPSLFQRLYYSEQRGQVAKFGFDASRATGFTDQTNLSFPFNFLVPKPALAVGEETPTIEEMIAQGEELFFEETFNGNGRTCGTCHPMENNLTIDPEFIETLPDDDPLFVAEFKPKLAQLEKPALMRQFGLILENVDGLDNPTEKFVMRGVPHTLALTTSLLRDSALPAGFPSEMTGWSGDGAPGSGALRDFATGAVTQHFTKTLKRKPGKDFRLPNDEELDAMEAFQLSLGRKADPNLSTLILTSTDAQTGKDIFVNGTGNPNAGGKCITCHFDAGARNNVSNAAGTNRNFNSGVEDLALNDNPVKQFDPTIPRDGGFGTVTNSPSGCTTAPSPDCGFGDGKFNTPSLVESADTGPFFHNNTVTTIEEAVEFFNGAHFNANPNNPRAPGAQFNLNATQVDQVATFLRVINALENVRSAIQFETNALSASNFGSAKNALRVAQAELDDAIEVLGVNTEEDDALAHLGVAAELIEDAINTPNSSERNDLINQAIDEGINAREDMCEPGSDAVLCSS